MDLGSEIQDPEKTYSGSRIQGQKGTGSRIRIRNTAKNHFKKLKFKSSLQPSLA
jgi:hypothetical protein